MKTKLIALTLVSLILSAAPLLAAPERLELKSGKQKSREVLAKSKVKTIQSSRIQDPEARKAVQEILNYLGMSQ